ncbi:hypothetical protein Tco_1287184 [Tanacetum coccineum]
MMVALFKSKNHKDFVLANNMNIVAETLVTRVRERRLLIGELRNCVGSIVAFESAKMLREINETGLAKARVFMTAISQLQIKEYEAKVIIRSKLKYFKLIKERLDDKRRRFGAVSLSCYSKGEMKFRDRVFSHRIGLTITSLDLLGVIENEEYFSKLCDIDVIRVCILLCLEVIFMGRLLVNEIDDTLIRLVDSLESWNAFP